jgi:glycosyltransferase involved in cell wall biosynthesis
MVNPRRLLFVQSWEPAFYPPLINAAWQMAEAGWQVHFLSARIAGSGLKLPHHPNISEYSIAERPSHVIRPKDFIRYLRAAAAVALRLKPQIVYASDPLGAAPGILAARLARAKLIYHEHDSPSPGTLNSLLNRSRGAAARSANIIIFPNEERARIAADELHFDHSRLRIIWNLPRVAEIPNVTTRANHPLTLYYHGSISPERLPESLVEGIVHFEGRVRLKLVGYEAPGANGYIDRLTGRGTTSHGERLTEYIGVLSRGKDLLIQAASAHVGLAFMPLDANDINMQHMTGASNKAFDYMASGLALLVSDLPDWHQCFVAPGFGLSCDPGDASSIQQTLQWFLDNPEERRRMGERSRRQIMSEWNYDSAFRPILTELHELIASA